RSAEARAAADGDRERSAEEVREAAELAKDCGALVLRNRAEDLARRLGLPLDASSGALPARPSGLTPREVEVLRLLARGSTNAEIGAALFISAKTASVHVSNSLAKLDVADRSAAGARARELGLAEAQTTPGRAGAGPSSGEGREVMAVAPRCRAGQCGPGPAAGRRSPGGSRR